MQSWDDVLWLFSQPVFWALILFGIALEPLLKYLRRFYPESLRKVANDTEEWTKELAKNENDVKLMKKSYLYEGSVIFLPALLVLAIYLIYSNANGIELTPIFITDSIASVLAPVLFISMGIVAINHDAILRYKLKDDYQKYFEIYNKANSIDPYVDFIEKNKKPFGYFFIGLGILAFFVPYFECGC